MLKNIHVGDVINCMPNTQEGEYALYWDRLVVAVFPNNVHLTFVNDKFPEVAVWSIEQIAAYKFMYKAY